jgi:hypothetical protein
MAKKSSSKSSSKRGFTKRVHELTKKDIVTSIAAVSILLNVLFLVTVIVVTNTDTFSRGVFTAARDQYCKSASAFEDRVMAIGSAELALQERNVDCISEGFLPFYTEAVEKYQAQYAEE